MAQKPARGWACVYSDGGEIVVNGISFALFRGLRYARNQARFWTKSSGEKVVVRRVTITVDKAPAHRSGR